MVYAAWLTEFAALQLLNVLLDINATLFGTFARSLLLCAEMEAAMGKKAALPARRIAGNVLKLKNQTGSRAVQAQNAHLVIVFIAYAEAHQLIVETAIVIQGRVAQVAQMIVGHAKQQKNQTGSRAVRIQTAALETAKIIFAANLERPAATIIQTAPQDIAAETAIIA